MKRMVSRAVGLQTSLGEVQELSAIGAVAVSTVAVVGGAVPIRVT